MRTTISFMSVTVLVILFAMPSSQATAQVTACLTPGGTLVNVTEGENPPGHSCAGNQTSIVIGQGEAEAASLPGEYKAWLSSAASGPRKSAF